MEQSWRQAKSIFATLITAPVFWLIAFFIVPMGIVWLYSFGENKGLIDVAFTGTWMNYAHAFDPLYLGIFWKSIVVAVITTFLCLLVGFPVAMAITFASEKAKSWLLMLIMLPFWTNLLIRTFALMAVLRTEGYVNMVYHFIWNLLVRMGLHLGDFQPLDLLYNNFAVIFGLVFVNLPFMVLPLYSTLDRMDRSLLEASLDLGAGHLRTIWNVMVPLAGPGIASGILITFIPALGSYLTPDLLGGPDSQMIANVIESQFKRANNWPFGAALSFILVYMTFIGVIIQGLIERANKRKGQS